MIMSTEEAYKILGFKNHIESINENLIEERYQKLIRRYPFITFPQKFLEIQTAYQLLTKDDQFWKDIFEDENPTFDYFILDHLRNHKNEKKIENDRRDDHFDLALIIPTYLKYSLMLKENINHNKNKM